MHSPSWGRENRAEEAKGKDRRKGMAFDLENHTDGFQSCLCLCLWGALPLWLGKFHCLVQGISVLLQVSPLKDVCALFQGTWVLVSAQVRLVALFLLAWLGGGKLLEQIVYQGLLKWGRQLSAFCFGISRSTETKSSPWAQQSLGQCRRWLRREDSCYHLLLELFCGCYNNIQWQWIPECPPVYKEKEFIRR